MNKEKYNQIIETAYEKYADSHWIPPSNPKGKLLSDQLFSLVPMEHSKESFIIKCKTDSEFSEKWGLLIKETYDLIPCTEHFGDVTITKPKRRNKLIVIYENETIEVYE
jgi:hypothetical protein